MEFDRRKSAAPTGGASNTRAAGIPGKRTLVDDLPQVPSHPRSSTPATIGDPPESRAAPLQRRSEGASADDPSQVHAAATRGTATAAVELPHARTLARAFGHHDVSGIKAHTGADAAASARAMGATAYATGDHIVLGESTDLHTVAHEAAHVVQQRGGVQLKAAVGEAGDAYEQHADRVADRVVAGQSAEGLLDERARTPRSSTGGSEPVQRTLKVGSKNAPVDITAAYQGQADHPPEAYAREVLNRVADEAGADSPLVRELAVNFEAVSRELARWIEDKPGHADADAHPTFGREKQNRHYQNYTELGQGALGWVKSEPNRQREKALAQQVYQHGVLDVYFSNLLHKTGLKITNLHLLDARADEGRKDAIVGELRTGKSTVPGHEGKEIGHYRHVFDTHPKGDAVKTKIPNGDMLHVLENAQSYDVKNKLVVFHDLMEYFGNPRGWITPAHGEGLLTEPAQDKVHSTTAIDADGNRTASTTDRGMAWPASFNNATRNENEAGTQLARQHDVPLWAGQSMTTVRVENLAEWVGASKEEKTALAWAIFAFWHIDYDHTSEWAYHTLHETMDMASNFGVDYNMLHREDSLNTFTLDHLKQDMRTQWTSLKAGGSAALQEFGHMDHANPRYNQVETTLKNVNQSLIDANTKFQEAKELPEAEQPGAAHEIMKQLNWCELNLRIARGGLGL